MDKIELLGGACFSHGPYTFYKAVRIGNGRVLRLGSFFLTKVWSDADLVSIGELQLLWLDSRGPNQPLASLRLYFLPENTPDGRRDTHGEDEVLTISEKVVVRVHDLVTWLSPSLEWSCGREVSCPPTPTSSPENSPLKPEILQPQVLTDPGIDFSDVEKQQKEYENNCGSSKKNESNNQPRVVVLSYPRYCRYRALLRRLEGAEPSWLCSSVAAALGGFTALPGTRVLFCKDTFDYPDLETHELLCNHLAPKLKGRPRRKRKKRSASPGESSNESEASVASVVASTSRSASTSSSLVQALRPPASGVRRSERKTSAEEKRFLAEVQTFMNTRGTPVGKMPLLGYRQIDLFLFYTKVQTLGGYDSVSAGRLWKSIYDDIGGNTGSTSAATITRRHYERLLLPYERHQKGEETKVRPTHGRRTKSSSMSEDNVEVKQEPGASHSSQTPPPPPGTPTSTAVSPPPLQSILSSPFLPGDKPRAESGKTSSLRSVRVKPERLKSLNTIIANSTSPATQSSPLPSPPPSVNTPTSTPCSTPSTTPTGGQSVLERQLNSPLMSQQVAPGSPPPTSLPVVTTVPNPSNASTVVTLTPPPEKDIKEMKLDPKQTSLLAQGKENIPLFGEKPIVPPRSPEVIDLETESDTSRDKIIIPSFKKRKLEILREGGLEVTAVELDARPSVIQATVAPVSMAPTLNAKAEEKTASPFPTPVTTNSVPKLISVTVTPDISHMLPSPHESPSPNRLPTPTKQPTINNNSHAHQNNNNTSLNNNNNNVANSRVINLGSSNNATLLQLYANANANAVSTSPSNSNHRFVPPGLPNGRIVPPKVTQSRSIFAHNERTVYGNPKDILIPTKYPHQHPQPPPHPPRSNNQSSGVLDLTQRSGEKQTFSRPSLEIVRVPIVPRPSPLNLEMKNNLRDKQQEPQKKSFTPYPNMLDSRTMISNNLEITLVNPKQKSHPAGAPPHIPPQQQMPATPTTRNNVMPTQRRQQANGKYPPRSEPVSPYTPRKPNHPVIPNVPNLNQLNSVANASYGRATQQQMAIERRKAEAAKEHRRTSEGDRSAMIPQQQQQHHQQQHEAANHRQPSDSSRRHSVPNVSTGLMLALPQNPAFLSQLPNPAGKFLPIFDPVYYPAFYNGLLPPPMAPASTPFLVPELSTYYKELLASSQPRLAMTGQHQPAVPTSK
ncbi:AT-rich interactive domain-containing protein 5B isoform X2 [Cephus cinctus]|uniref:AT-rich interactive domain-containing protein 5B isoform X2 n=1 Tax=Cephus cinctus TaxID=211228 RepID=A0AAJ7BWR5_CEPCN|nr:AT-rich interactive domain-containing protein 5B isoform X2 [Cephus cinctus]